MKQGRRDDFRLQPLLGHDGYLLRDILPSPPDRQGFAAFQGYRVEYQLIGVEGGFPFQLQGKDLPDLPPVAQGQFQFAQEKKTGRQGKDDLLIFPTGRGRLFQHGGKGALPAYGLAEGPGKDERAALQLEPGEERFVSGQLHNQVIHQYSLQKRIVPLLFTTASTTRVVSLTRAREMRRNICPFSICMILKSLAMVCASTPMPETLFPTSVAEVNGVTFRLSMISWARASVMAGSSAARSSLAAVFTFIGATLPTAFG